MRCPQCETHLVRVERRGFLEEKIYPMFGYYPWKCRSCKARIQVRQREEQGRRHNFPKYYSAPADFRSGNTAKPAPIPATDNAS